MAPPKAHPEMKILSRKCRSLLLHLHKTGQRVVISQNGKSYCLDQDMTEVQPRTMRALFSRLLISEPGLLIIPSSGGGLTEEGLATVKRMRKKD